MKRTADGITFSLLEFWLIISLLICICSSIAYIAFQNAGSGSALNFVSFAATLISIILAVVAIGYTYGESIADRGKTDRLTNEITKLTDIRNDLSEYSKAFEKIEVLKSNLDSMKPHIEDTSLAVSKLLNLTNHAFVSDSQNSPRENDFLKWINQSMSI